MPHSFATLRYCLFCTQLALACSASSDPIEPAETVPASTEPAETVPAMSEPAATLTTAPIPSAITPQPTPSAPLPSMSTSQPSAPPPIVEEVEAPILDPVEPEPHNPNQPNSCNPTLTGIVRDFRPASDPDGHPDFEAPFASDTELPGIVKARLGDDQKPVYAMDGPAFHPQYGQMTHGKTEFDQWYRDVADVNESIVLELPLTQGENGIWSYENMEFYPIDDQGFGNNPNYGHNFGFTFELHTQFVFEGDEVFTFTGDDDLWVFINDTLAIDLGGLHPKLTQSVDLQAQAQALGLSAGATYALDLFHAERHTDASRFRIDTNIRFTHCRPIIVR